MEEQNLVPPVPGELTYRRKQGRYCKSLVVAVHGMGDQVRNEFVQDIATLFARHYARPDGHTEAGVPDQATRLPLGLWSNGGTPVEDDVVGFVPKVKDSWLNKFGFAEVYWAHIPRRVDDEQYRLEESKKWAASVVERLCQRHGAVAEFMPGGPALAATVVQEIAETLRILDRVFLVAQKLGFMKLNSARILAKFLGDVQQVADSEVQRTAIRREFLLRMQHLAKVCPHVEEIHVVAHSEGTVVALLGLLYALRHQTVAEWQNEKSRREMAQGDAEQPGEPEPGVAALDLEWIHKVRSFTTLGSPIDKHLHLWPEMWFKFTKERATWKRLAQKIRWRNYYDFADPVGFDLQTARVQLDAWGCKAFDFQGGSDHGFHRYLLPGAAHVDYFDDDDLFRHIIRRNIESDCDNAGQEDESRRKQTEQGVAHTWKGRVAPWLPFVLVGGIFFTGVVLLLKATIPHAGVGVLGSSALLYGAVGLSRVGRIKRWAGLSVWKAAAGFAAGAGAFLAMPGSVPAVIAQRLGLAWLVEYLKMPLSAALVVKIGIIALTTTFVWIAKRVDEAAVSKRRSPVWGLRSTMILGGAAVLFTLVLPALFQTAKASEAVATLLAAGLFFYLWWLGTLIFDLAYVWRSYINTQKPLMKARVPAPVANAELDPGPEDGGA